MWRYGLLRCNARLGLIKTSYLNPKIYVQNSFTKNVALFPNPTFRSYSKLISEALPDINLEVKHTDHESIESESEGKVFRNDVQVIHKDEPRPVAIKSIEPDLLELSVNADLGKRSLIEDIKGPNDKASIDLNLAPSVDHDQARPSSPKSKDTWFSIEDESPVRRYENDQEQLLFEAIDTPEFEKWDELQEKVLSAGDTINEQNIQVSIMEKCLAHKRIETGLRYLNYLSTSTQEPNIVTIGKFCRLAALCASEVNDNIQNIITSSYDSLRARYPVFDASTAESVIHGLSITKRWKEGLEILDEIRITCAPHKTSYSALIKASFNNDEPDIGWELLSKMLQDNKQPMDDVYASWLQYCKRSAAGNKTMGQKLVHKMLHFLANNDIRLTEAAAISFRLWFEYDSGADWNVEFTTVDSRGMCKSCHQYLKALSVTREEFESMKAILIEKTIVGSNIFLKSSPEELQKYEQFVKSTAPYDVVIDGLNVGYSAHGAKTPYNFAKQLHSVVEHFVSRSERVLVLGRRHMNSWPKRFMDYVYENAEVFLTDNLSQDDPYLLYATVYSGPGARFISRDLMRGHTFLLKDPRMQSIFRRWQKQSQLQVLYAGEVGQVRFRQNQRFDTSTQTNRNGTWHVPYNRETDSLRNAALNSPRQWLCVNHYAEQRYDDRFQEDDFADDSSRKFANRQKNRVYASEDRRPRFGRRDAEDSFDSDDENKAPQFNRQKNRVYASEDRRPRFGRRDAEDSFDSDDENKASQFRRREYGAERVSDGGERQSRFRRVKAATDRFDDEDEEGETKHFTKRGPRRAYSTMEDYSAAGAQFGGDRGPVTEEGTRGLRTESEEYGEERTLRSKQEERLKGEMLESESKQAFKSGRTRERPVRREED